MRTSILFTIFAIFLAITTFTSCNTNEEKTMDAQTMTIALHAQATYKDLRLGIGFIGDDPFILQDENRKIESVQIWPFLRNEEKGRPSMLVHEKEIVDIDVYQLKILKITKDSVKIRFAQRTP